MKNYIKLMLSVLFLFVLVGTLAGCKTANVLPPTKTEIVKNITTKEVVHDTIFKTAKDSSYFKAWLECKEGKVIFKSQPTKTKGKFLQPPKVILKDNQITVDCEAEAQQLFAKWKDVYIKENSETKNTIPILVEKQLTSWQTFQIWLGRIFLGLILVIITITVLRNRSII